MEAYKFIKGKFDEEIQHQDSGCKLTQSSRSQPPARISSTTSSPRTITSTNIPIEMVDDDMKITDNEISDVSVKTETVTDIGNSPCIVEFEFDDIEEVSFHYIYAIWSLSVVVVTVIIAIICVWSFLVFFAFCP